MDKREKVLEMLRNYKYNKSRVWNIELEICRHQRCGADYSIPSFDYSKDKISSTNAVSSTVENAIMNVEREIERLERKKNDIEIDVKLIDNSLYCLDEMEKQIIELRYTVERTCKRKEIVNELNISESWFDKLHASAVEKMGKVIFGEG